tara:strand:- start:537 stop:1091 length:555 start_codon:yes stop_codon:yes gene_type:complete
MENSLSNFNQLNIDLSFISMSFQDLEICFDHDSLDLIQSSNFWNYEIASWINFIQLDKKFKCPKIVRSASTLSLGLEFTNDEKILNLNNAWLGKSKSTDVLSFPIIDETFFVPGSECIELGDIVISVPTAIKQAKDNNVDLLRELRWLASHGLLHLLGWDHCDQESLTQMLITQEQLLDLRGNV